MDHEKFKNIAEGTQSLVLAVAAIVAGGWAYFTFTALGSVNKAAAEQAELEQRIRQEPVLQIALSAQSATASTDGRLVLVDAVLKNNGKRALQIDFPESPLLVSRIIVGNDQMQLPSPPMRAQHVKLKEDGKLEPVKQRILRAGQSRSIPFVVRVPEAGDYLVQFASTYSGVELDTGTVTSTKDVPIEAIGQLFIHVGQSKLK